jgi:DNA repair protein RadC
MKDVPAETRPRERLLREGPSSLSESELLAIVLRTGSSDDTVVALANEILARFGGLRRLAEASQEELCEIRGVGPAKVAEIKGALELGRRLYQEDYRYRSQQGRPPGQERIPLNTPEAAADYMMAKMRFLDREQITVLCLDARNQLLEGEAVVSVGTVSSSVAHPRECFKEAIRRSATSVIFVHNHPSGDPSPSAEDIALTRQLGEAGKVLGIDVLDHVILGDGTYVSMKERGLF